METPGTGGPTDPNPELMTYQATPASTTTTATTTTRRTIQVLRECLLGVLDWTASSAPACAMVASSRYRLSFLMTVCLTCRPFLLSLSSLMVFSETHHLILSSPNHRCPDYNPNHRIKWGRPDLNRRSRGPEPRIIPS